jgi:DNA invertase Pin-like site-specific DNA recombinase
MPVVYGYGRHSTDKQCITESVQAAAVLNYVANELQQDGLVWGGWLYDTAESASMPLTERPKGRELWALVQPKDHVVWYKIDRAFRSVIDGSKTLQMFNQKGVFVHSLDLRMNTSTPLGKFFQVVMLAVAELELDQLRARTSEALLTLKSQGRPYSHTVPMGYRRIPKVHGKKGTGRIDPCPNERNLIRQIHQQTLMMSHERTWWWVQNQIRDGNVTSQRKWQKKSIAWALLALAMDFPKLFTFDDLKAYAKANPALRDATVQLPPKLASRLFGDQLPARGPTGPA